MGWNMWRWPDTGNWEKETQMAVKVAMIGHLSVGVLSLKNPLYESRWITAWNVKPGFVPLLASQVFAAKWLIIRLLVDASVNIRMWFDRSKDRVLEPSHKTISVSARAALSANSFNALGESPNARGIAYSPMSSHFLFSLNCGKTMVDT